LKKCFDLLEHDRGQVLPLADIRIVREGRVHRHADQLLVAAVLVLEVEHADRPGADDAAGMNGERATTSASSGSPSGESVCGTKP
jgi:hypothetical protein